MWVCGFRRDHLSRLVSRLEPKGEPHFFLGSPFKVHTHVWRVYFREGAAKRCGSTRIPPNRTKQTHFATDAAPHGSRALEKTSLALGFRKYPHPPIRYLMGWPMKWIHPGIGQGRVSADFSVSPPYDVGALPYPTPYFSKSSLFAILWFVNTAHTLVASPC